MEKLKESIWWGVVLLAVVIINCLTVIYYHKDTIKEQIFENTPTEVKPNYKDECFKNAMGHRYTKTSFVETPDGFICDISYDKEVSN